MKKAAIIIGVVIVIAIIIVYFFVYNKSGMNYERAKPDFRLSVKELYNAYINNRSDAEKKFNGKMVEINGELNSSEITDTSATAIFVMSEGMFGDEGIRCVMLPKFITEMKNYYIGDKITIKGYCSGYNETDVILEHSSVKTK